MMNKISYENVFGLTSSSKGKMPWIELNGQQFADSQFIIQHLSQIHNIHIDSHLTLEQKAVSESLVAMMEESLYWTIVYSRWLCNPWWLINEHITFMPTLLARFLLPIGISGVRKQLHGQGYGRHSSDEIKYIVNKQLSALSSYLGDKAYLFGSVPSFADIVLFSLIGASFEDNLFIEIDQALRTNSSLSNLVSFFRRFKAAHWEREWGTLASSSSDSSKKSTSPSTPQSDSSSSSTSSQ